MERNEPSVYLVLEHHLFAIWEELRVNLVTDFMSVTLLHQSVIYSL